MMSIIKTIFVCLGAVAGGSMALYQGSYWPLMISSIGLFGYLFCEFYILRPKKNEDN